jgi:sulfatase modifying factor 1
VRSRRLPLAFTTLVVGCLAQRAEIVDHWDHETTTSGGSGGSMGVSGGTGVGGSDGAAVGGAPSGASGDDGGGAAGVPGGGLGGEPGSGAQGGALNGAGGEVAQGGEASGGLGGGGSSAVEPGASCIGLPNGLCGGEPCCAAGLVTGGSFKLGGNVVSPSSQAKVSSFYLDNFEVTVARFRKSLENYAGPPQEGAGKHPKVADSGWNKDWSLPNSVAAYKSSLKCDAMWGTWTDQAIDDEHEAHPINCVNWYEAFAFCVWDGGRLPTEAEWEYAATGGDGGYPYPWGDEAPSASLATYACNGDGDVSGPCSSQEITPVGSHPLGKGRYGQFDLAGSMWEWALDAYADYAPTCDDCANLTGSTRLWRGGSWYSQVTQISPRFRASRDAATLTVESRYVGFRCAHDQHGN